MASVSVLGEQVVIGRTKLGELFALRDRCPHRGAPLSEGRFDGVAITCPFHGWRFGADGRCRAMPTLVDGDVTDPGQVKVGEFPIRESDGIIWLYLGTRPELAPPVPALALAGKTRCRVAVSVLVEASYDLSVLSLIDPGHVGYVHNSWWWRPTATAQEKVKDFEPLPFGFRMKAHKAGELARLSPPRAAADGSRLSAARPADRADSPRRARDRQRDLRHADRCAPDAADQCAAVGPAATHAARAGDQMGRAGLPAPGPADSRTRSAGLERKPTMLLLGQADRLAQWYFRLKRDYATARREGTVFANELTPERLRWRT